MINTKQMLDLLPVVSSIYKKIDIEEFLNSYKASENKELGQEIAGLDMFAYIMEQSSDIQSELMQIVSTIDNKTIKEIEEQHFIDTLETIRVLTEDKKIMGFFKRAIKSEGTKKQ